MSECSPGRWAENAFAARIPAASGAPCWRGSMPSEVRRTMSRSSTRTRNVSGHIHDRFAPSAGHCGTKSGSVRSRGERRTRLSLTSCGVTFVRKNGLPVHMAAAELNTGPVFARAIPCLQATHGSGLIATLPCLKSKDKISFRARIPPSAHV